MTLKNWSENGWLKSHETSREEIETLLKKVERDIAQTASREINDDWKLTIAYFACLGCADIALRASGYRVAGGSGQHRYKIESLRFTLQPETDTIILLGAVSKKRGIANYDAAGTVSQTEVKEAVELARELRRRLVAWLGSTHPELGPFD